MFIFIFVMMFIFAVVIVLALCKAASVDLPQQESCEACRYFKRSIMHESCSYCERGNEYEKSELEGQEWE